MFESIALDGSTISGALVLVVVLASFRFGDALVDLLLSYRSSSLEAIENSIPERD